MNTPPATTSDLRTSKTFSTLTFLRKTGAGLLLLASTGLVCGQGYVSFANSTTTKVSTNGMAQAAAPIGTWYYALLVAPSTQNTINSSLAGWTFVAGGTNTAFGGRLSGNNEGGPGGPCVQVPGYAGTATADFAVVGWSANVGGGTMLTPGAWTNVLAWWNQGLPAQGSRLNGGSGWFGISGVANDVPLSPVDGPRNSVFGTSSAGRIQGLGMSYYYLNRSPLSWSGGSASSGNWNEPANWGFVWIPQDGCLLTFPATALRHQSTNDIPLPKLFIYSICFAGAGGGYDLYGNDFTLAETIQATNNVPTTNTILANFDLWGGVEHEINVSTGSTLILAGSLSGAGELWKYGTGTVILAAPTNACRLSA